MDMSFALRAKSQPGPMGLGFLDLWLIDMGFGFRGWAAPPTPTRVFWGWCGFLGCGGARVWTPIKCNAGGCTGRCTPVTLI